MTAIDIQAAAPEMNLVQENRRFNLKRTSGALYRTSSFRYPYGYGKYVEYCPRTYRGYYRGGCYPARRRMWIVYGRRYLGRFATEFPWSGKERGARLKLDTLWPHRQTGPNVQLTIVNR